MQEYNIFFKQTVCGLLHKIIQLLQVIVKPCHLIEKKNLVLDTQHYCINSASYSVCVHFSVAKRKKKTPGIYIPLLLGPR